MLAYLKHSSTTSISLIVGYGDLLAWMPSLIPLCRISPFLFRLALSFCHTISLLWPARDRAKRRDTKCFSAGLWDVRRGVYVGGEISARLRRGWNERNTNSHQAGANMREEAITNFERMNERMKELKCMGTFGRLTQFNTWKKNYYLNY